MSNPSLPFGWGPVQHAVPEALLTCLGDVMVSFAVLEDTMQAIMVRLLRAPGQVGNIVSTALSFSNLRAILISLYLEQRGHDAEFEILKALVSEAGKVEEERNRLTHSVWAAGKTPATVHRMKFTAREKRGFEFQAEEYDEAKLRVYADSIRVLAGKFAAFGFYLARRS